MAFSGPIWADNGDRAGPNALTPDEARRFRASTRFSVGDGIRLRGVDPARPSPGGAVVIVDVAATVRGVAVLTDVGTDVHDHRFALWAPPPDSISTAVAAFADLLQRPWVLVEAGASWNEIVRTVTRSLAQDTSAFETVCATVDPVTGHRLSMVGFLVPEVGSVASPTSRSPATGGPQVTGIADLATAMDVLASIKEAYAAYECDYQRVLAAPALADVTVDATAAFVEAFTVAVALEPERPDSCPPEHATRFRSAVAAAEAAWEAAEAHATRSGITGFDPTQRAQIRRARQALDLALRADTPAGEREVSLAVARRLLDGLVTFPAPLEAVITRAIPAASGPRAALDP